MFVLAADSSMKISLEGSNAPYLLIHALRAWTMSSRSCSLARRVFFICQPHGVKDIVDGGKRALQSKGFPQFLERHVGLGTKQLAHVLAVALHNEGLATTTVVPRTYLPSVASLLNELLHHAKGDSEAFGYLIPCLLFLVVAIQYPFP